MNQQLLAGIILLFLHYLQYHLVCYFLCYLLYNSRTLRFISICVLLVVPQISLVFLFGELLFAVVLISFCELDCRWKDLLSTDLQSICILLVLISWLLIDRVFVMCFIPLHIVSWIIVVCRSFYLLQDRNRHLVSILLAVFCLCLLLYNHMAVDRGSCIVLVYQSMGCECWLMGFNLQHEHTSTRYNQTITSHRNTRHHQKKQNSKHRQHNR